MFGNPSFFALLLVIASTVLQSGALLGWWPPVTEADWLLFGGLEMLLIVLLLANGGAIIGIASEDARSRKLAGWAFTGLLLCSFGDLVNRNFSNAFFRHGNLIEHDYLADSVWFFLPGYAVLIAAAWMATAAYPQVRRWRVPLLVLCGTLGMLSYLSMHRAGSGLYITSLTAAYSVVITCGIAAAIWLLQAFGATMWMVAAGFILAAAADALIGQFWLFGNGHYPDIRYINWIIYFVSQALIQQLPLRLMKSPALA